MNCLVPGIQLLNPEGKSRVDRVSLKNECISNGVDPCAQASADSQIVRGNIVTRQRY